MPRHQRGREHGLHDFAALVCGDVANPSDSAIGFGTRRAKIDNLGVDPQNVARPNGIGPAQFIHAETDCALGKVQSLNKQPHRNRRRVPAARDQAFEHRSLRDGRIEMKTLRIELPRKLNDLLFCNLGRLRSKPIARVEVIKITLVHLERN